MRGEREEERKKKEGPGLGLGLGRGGEGALTFFDPETLAFLLFSLEQYMTRSSMSYETPEGELVRERLGFTALPARMIGALIFEQLRHTKKVPAPGGRSTSSTPSRL